MHSHRHGQHRDLVPVLLALVLMAELTVSALTLVVFSLPAPVGPVAGTTGRAAGGAAAGTAAGTAARPSRSTGSAGASTQTSPGGATPGPVSPALVIDQPLVPLGLTRSGSLEVPETAATIGRWRDGPQPGDVGPAVLVGHVDLDGQPGVFAGLSRLLVGDVVAVARPDGRTARFRVTRTARLSKSAFPTEAVYAPTAGAELRLVTCGGSFDRLRGHYRDNVVVFAVAT